MRFNPCLLVLIIIAHLCFLWVVPEAYGQTEGKIVKSIGIRGNKRVDKDTIMFYIKLKKGDKYSSSKVNEDIKAIYGLGQFEDIKVEATNFKNGIKLIYIVKEIPSIREVSFVGNKKMSTEKLGKKLIASKGLKKGSLYNKTLVKKTEKLIKKSYEEKGFFLVTVQTIAKRVNRDQLDIIIKISENKKVGIKKIYFIGNKAFTDKELKKQLGTKEKNIFSFITDAGIYQKEMIKADQLKVELFYRENGYINAKVLDPMINVDKNEKAIFIKIPVEEGDQYKTGKIGFIGDDTFPEKKLREKIDLKKGDVYNLRKIREGVFNIAELYSQQGHAYADVRPERVVNAPKRIVDTVLQIDKGRKVYIGKITISGNLKTKDKVIRREFRFAEGSLFDSEKLRRSRERIINTRFFEDVQIQTSRGEKDDTIDITTSVVERPTGTVGAGIGYSSIDNAIVTAQLSQDNLLGNGHKLEFSTELSSRRLDFSLGFTEPWLFDREISAGIDLFNTKADFTTFESKRQGGGLRLGKAFTEYTWGNIGYRFENITISDVAPENETNFLNNETRITSRISPKITRDTQDNRLNPTEGTTENLSAQYAGGILGGVNFYKLSAEKSYYHPLFLGLVGMLHGKIAYAKGYSGDVLPVYERYFMGGPLDLRGFTFEDVGPQDSDGNPLGGEKLLLFNAEIQYPFNNSLRGIIFYDRGNVYGNGGDISLTSENFSLSNMRHSLGVALQLHTAFGPVGLAYGYKLDQADGEEPAEFHFIFGRTF
ncbi:MAG: outer membrane protein assembly factor BamA [Nitrospinota bacterium]|jgi:outer membrane protein insertion porin family|nr:outer membrane protein assembly factor BamA [Nitrospinota bacterium]MDP7350136.1 outer membrane protein assembly factor BamA [Nitrospinota bacterium]MDP7580656.1 outer membrane protein assembly factor BamA [Nitrospinota bacterium]